MRTASRKSAAADIGIGLQAYDDRLRRAMRAMRARSDIEAALAWDRWQRGWA